MAVIDSELRIMNKVLRYFGRGARILNSSFRARGLWQTLRLALEALLSIRFCYRLEKTLSNPEEKVDPKIPLTVTIISGSSSLEAEDLNNIVKLRGYYGIINFHERLDRGDIMFCAHSERNFVGFVWLDLPPVDHRNAGYRLENDEAYTYDCYTFREYRGNKILPAIQQVLFAYLREKRSDIHSIVTHIMTKNKPSIAGFKRAGYIITGQDLYVVILGYYACFRLKKF